jgi:hypothetical protein
MDDQRTEYNRETSVTPRILLAVAVAYLAVSYLSGAATFVLAFVTGPFASLIVGIILLFVAVRIYRGGT